MSGLILGDKSKEIRMHLLLNYQCKFWDLKNTSSFVCFTDAFCSFIDPPQKSRLLLSCRVALSSKVLPYLMRCQIRHMLQKVHVFAVAYFVYLQTFQISFGIRFYTLGRLLIYWTAPLRMRRLISSHFLVLDWWSLVMFDPSNHKY